MSDELCRIKSSNKHFPDDVLVFECGASGFKFMIEFFSKGKTSTDISKFWFDFSEWERLKEAVDIAFDERRRTG